MAKQLLTWLPSWERKGCTRLRLPEQIAISLGTEVDIGACESSPADGALFASLSPDQGLARERALS